MWLAQGDLLLFFCDILYSIYRVGILLCFNLLRTLFFMKMKDSDTCIYNNL